MVDPKAYAASVDGVDCSNAINRYTTIKPFLPIAKRIIRQFSTVPVKGEFETSAAFQARNEAFTRDALGGTDTVIYVQDVPNAQLIYNADTQQLEIKYLYESDSYGHPHRPDGLRQFGFQLFYGDAVESTYRAGNAFGATVNVEKRVNTRGVLLFSPDGLAKNEQGSIGGKSFFVPMAPEAAMAFKRSAKMIIVGRAKTPFVDKALTQNQPTITDPWELNMTSYGFSTDVQCIVLAYDNKEVLRMGAR